MRRGEDGRVQLRKEDGTWMQVRITYSSGTHHPTLRAAYALLVHAHAQPWQQRLVEHVQPDAVDWGPQMIIAPEACCSSCVHSQSLLKGSLQCAHKHTTCGQHTHWRTVLCPFAHAQVKLDMEVRGTMLLRNMADDTIWVLQTELLEQVRRD
jgi:hypothetical protein